MNKSHVGDIAKDMTNWKSECFRQTAGFAANDGGKFGRLIRVKRKSKSNILGASKNSKF